MPPDTPASTLHKNSPAFATPSPSSKPTYIPTSVLPSPAAQQTPSTPSLQRRNSRTQIQNHRLRPSLALRPLEASTQAPLVPLPTSRWYVLSLYGLHILARSFSRQSSRTSMIPTTGNPVTRLRTFSLQYMTAISLPCSPTYTSLMVLSTSTLSTAIGYIVISTSFPSLSTGSASKVVLLQIESPLLRLVP